MAYRWAPNADTVALYVPQRVSDSSGTFTDTSIPDRSTVDKLIGQVAEDVYAAIGDPPDNLVNAAGHVTALGTAVLIESDFTSNEAEEKSPRLADLNTRYENALKRLVGAVQETPGKGVPDPVYGFPDLSTTAETPFGALTGGMSWATDF